MTVRIAPSLLSVDFARMADQLAMIEAAGADWLHVDVMDGVFVPNITFGVKVIETVRKLTTLPLDVHLMTVEPEKYFESFAKAGVNGMTVHVETAPHLHRQLMRIKELGCTAGATLNPSTSLETVRDVAGDLDLLLIMTVNPGFGGQSFIQSQLAKMRQVRQMIDRSGRQIELEVDGGVNGQTAALAVEAGADVLVAGTAVFGGKPALYAENIARLRQ